MNVSNSDSSDAQRGQTYGLYRIRGSGRITCLLRRNRRPHIHGESYGKFDRYRPIFAVCELGYRAPLGRMVGFVRGTVPSPVGWAEGSRAFGPKNEMTAIIHAYATIIIAHSHSSGV